MQCLLEQEKQDIQVDTKAHGIIQFRIHCNEWWGGGAILLLLSLITPASGKHSIVLKVSVSELRIILCEACRLPPMSEGTQRERERERESERRGRESERAGSLLLFFFSFLCRRTRQGCSTRVSCRRLHGERERRRRLHRMPAWQATNCLDMVSGENVTWFANFWWPALKVAPMFRSGLPAHYVFVRNHTVAQNRSRLLASSFLVGKKKKKKGKDVTYVNFFFLHMHVYKYKPIDYFFCTLFSNFFYFFLLSLTSIQTHRLRRRRPLPSNYWT